MGDDTILSIGICTLEERKDLLSDLLHSLEAQWDPRVQIIIESDNREQTTGHKRNRIIDRATGRYLCYVDDDDEVHQHYIKRILDAAYFETDCIGLVGVYYDCGVYSGLFQHSIRNREWKDNLPGKYRYLRNPNHLNPVKLSIIKEHNIRFPDIVINEDRSYSTQLLPHLTTETMIEVPLYAYNCGKPNS